MLSAKKSDKSRHYRVGGEGNAGSMIFGGKTLNLQFLGGASSSYGIFHLVLSIKETLKHRRVLILVLPLTFGKY